jgi:2-isopropylmalate synthase
VFGESGAAPGAQVPAELLEFSVHAVTEGIDALGEVSVRVRALSERGTHNAQKDTPSAPVFHGSGADSDIIVASAKAYLKALNRMLAALGHGRPVAARATVLRAPVAMGQGRPS